MQKVVGVNLNGNAYQIEEAGYAALRAYLERAEARLANNPDKAEIVADLEQAIADKCGARLGAHKTVVTAAEIDQILGEMGPVDAGDATAGAAKGAADADAHDGSTATPAASKRLYQIRDGAMISGVCNGIAAYFDIDVTIVRIVFAVLALVSKGLFLLVYIALMLIIPYADTPEQQAAARGRRFTAQDLIDQAKRNYEDFRTNKHWRLQWRRQQRAWRRQWRYTFHGAPWAAGSQAQYASQAAAGVATPIFGLIHAAIVLTLALAFISLATTHTLFGHMMPSGIPYWAAFGILIFVYQAIAWPFYYAGRQAYAVNPAAPFAWLSPVFSILWLGFIGFSIWWGYHHIPEVHDFIQALPDMWQQVVIQLKQHK
jgi:phage shock protein PspC (stress-responsive transcriptional regulator)